MKISFLKNFENHKFYYNNFLGIRLLNKIYKDFDINLLLFSVFENGFNDRKNIF